MYHPGEYEEQIALLKDPDSVEMKELIPAELRDCFRPILLALLQRDPAHRASVQQLLDNDWLMKEGDEVAQGGSDRAK